MKKNIFINKISLFSLVGMSLISLSCAGKTFNLKIINEKSAKLEIEKFRFDYEYEYATPGAYLTYNYLWDGTSLQDSQTEVVRYYFSFLTEYKESNNTYCLAYLKQSKINTVQE